MLFKRHLPAVFVCLVFGVFFFISMAFLFRANVVQAADLTLASIKLERQKANTSPGSILVQFRTTESVVEDGVQVTVGQAWSNSVVATDYTVSTAGLPAGVTALPGIATAQTVIGKVVTFPTSDLVSGVTYGFYITGGIASNPATGNDLNYVWNLATLVAGTPSSDQDVGVPVIANDQIVFTARVGPTTQDFSAVVSTTHSGIVSPNDILSYTITYGSDHVDPTPLTLQFEWSLGTLEGSGTPTVPVFSYIDGSASQAYGATDPVIDTINRTITWTMHSFPAATQNQTVTFQLQAAAIDTGIALVNVPVSARIIVPVSTPDSTITHQYQFATPTPSPTPTPTSSQGPTSTPQPSSKKACNLGCATDTECDTNYCYLAEQRCRSRQQPQDDRCGAANVAATVAPTLSPIPTISAVTFRSITTTQISHDSITLEILLSQAKAIELYYGTSINDLSLRVPSPTTQFLHSLELPSLLPATTYYFRAQTLDEAGKVVKSNVYQATTAQTRLELGDAQFVTVVTSRGIVLYNQTDQLDRYPLVIPQQTDYEVNLTFASDFPITKAKLMVRAQTDFSDGAVQQLPVSLTETKPRTFNGKLLTGMPSNEQFVILQIEDTGGNHVYQIKADFVQVIHTIMAQNPTIEFVLQPFLLFDQGFEYNGLRASTDIRLLFHHNQLFQCYLRMAKTDDFRCNEHQGGQLVYIATSNVPEVIHAIAKKIVKKINKPQALYALDFAVSNAGRIYLVEGNITPGIDWDVTKVVNEKRSKQLIRRIVKEFTVRKKFSLFD